MTVFVLHAPQDAAQAESLERFLERRGHFVELESGQGPMRPVQSADTVVAFVSKDFVFSPHRLLQEKRALEAWAEDRLVLVKLDKSFAPVGLRDLPAVDASFEAQRDPFTWGEIDKAIRAKLQAHRQSQSQEQEEDVLADGAPPPAGAGPAPQAPPAERSRSGPQKPPSAKRKGGGWLGVILIVLLMAPGLAALAVSVSVWLVNRIGPTPGTIADTVAGVDAYGMRYGVPEGVTPYVFGAAIAVTALTLLFVVGKLVSLLIGAVFRGAFGASAKGAPAPRRKEAAEASIPAPVGGNAMPDAVFVSYARANSTFVMPVIEGAKKQGRKFWLDTEALGGGDSWAGEIVRAIRGSKDVCVMCSNAAFESDHVKREVYLADRYKKRLVPVFVEEVAPPEDFEYFFAGVQWLKLYETPETERPAALVRALGAA